MSENLVVNADILKEASAILDEYWDGVELITFGWLAEKMKVRINEFDSAKDQPPFMKPCIRVHDGNASIWISIQFIVSRQVGFFRELELVGLLCAIQRLRRKGLIDGHDNKNIAVDMKSEIWKNLKSIAACVIIPAKAILEVENNQNYQNYIRRYCEAFFSNANYVREHYIRVVDFYNRK